MTSLQAYKKFLLKLNKNDTNTKIKISKGEFVLLFNELKRVWLDDKLEQLNSSDLINELSDIYIVDFSLEKDNATFKDKTLFKLPSDFQKIASSYSIAKKGNCIKKLYNWPKKPKNKNAALQNTNTNSSFEFEQAITEESNFKLVVYKNDFDILEQYVSYYKEPKDIDLEGYIKIDGVQSTTINPDLSDKNVDQIINRCVIEASINYENAETVQFSQLRNK